MEFSIEGKGVPDHFPSFFNRLLCYGTQPKVFCPYCCYGFRKSCNGKRNLAEHKIHCREHGPQRTQYLKKDGNFIEFNEFEKMQRVPFTIYADFEAINRKIHGCDPNPEQSNTNKKTHHEASGFTILTVSPYYPTNRITYRGRDAGKVFLEMIVKEEKRVLSLLDDIKEMDISDPTSGPVVDGSDDRWAPCRSRHCGRWWKTLCTC